MARPRRSCFHPRVRPTCSTLALVALAACAGPAAERLPPLPTGHTEAAARETLSRFARALQAGRWPEAYALLSGRWRSAYTPSRLGIDYDGAGPLGREETERILALLAAGAPLAAHGDRLALPVGTGRAAVLVPEGVGWRVDAHE
jgi:hypothetical protein